MSSVAGKAGSVQLSDGIEDGEGEEKPLLSDGAAVPSNSLFSSASNLTQNTLGAGVFGIPMALASTGLGGGVAALVLVCVVSAFTLQVLGKLVKQTRTRTYQGLLTVTMGKGVAVVAECLIVVGQFGGSVISLMLIRDNLYSVVHFFSGGVSEWYTDRKFLLGMFVLLPGALAFLPRLKFLSYGSSLGIALVIYAVGFVSVDGIIFLATAPVRPAIVQGINLSLFFFQGFPTLFWAFVTHIGFVPIYSEMSNPTPKRSFMLVLLNTVISMTLYLFAGIVAYMRIGNDCFVEGVQSEGCLKLFPYFASQNTTSLSLGNVLNFYPPNDVPAIIGRLGMCITVAMNYPLGVYLGRITVHTLVPALNRHAELPGFWFVVITLVWIVSSLLVAMFVQSVSIVFDVLGAITSSAFMMLFPLLMFQRMYYRKNIPVSIGLFALIAIGLVAGVIGMISDFLPT